MKCGGAARGVPDVQWRADELEPTSSSFFIFFSHDIIFITRLWRQRWALHAAMEVAVCAEPMAVGPV
jgi:hypothetical protein